MADAGNPIKLGYQAHAHGANPTAVAAGDVVRAHANRHGVPWVIGGHPNIITREVRVQDADGAQTNAALATVAAGSRIVVTSLAALADGANSVDVAIRIGFGTATLPTAALAGVNGVLLSHDGLAAGAGVKTGDGTGILGIGADDEDLRYTCEDPVSGGLRLTVSYYTVES